MEVAAKPGTDEDDAAAPAAETPPFTVGAGVADVATGRERRLAAGLREFEGRAGAVVAAVAAYVAAAEIVCWWEVVERRDSVGEAARSGLSGLFISKEGKGTVLVGGVEERTFLSEHHCVSANWYWYLRSCLSSVSCLPLDQGRPPVDQGVFSCWTSCSGRPSSRAWRHVGDGHSRTWRWGRRSGGRCAGRRCGVRGWRS